MIKKFVSTFFFLFVCKISLSLQAFKQKFWLKLITCVD